MAEKKARSFNQFTYKPKTRKRLGKRQRLTIPGQAISVKEILAKHSRGMPIPKDNHGQYFGEIDVPDFESMDLTEIADYTKELKALTENLESQLKQRSEEKENEQKGEKSTEMVHKEQDVVPTENIQK